MMQIPDAPWIRDAEQNGIPEAPGVYCPICYAKNPDYFYTDKTGVDVIGCDECVKTVDPWEWTADHQ